MATAIDKSVFSINLEDVGRVIGKGGARIKQFRDETSCRINVVPLNSDATVEVIHSDENTRTDAIEMIRKYLDRMSFRRDNGNPVVASPVNNTPPPVETNNNEAERTYEWAVPATPEDATPPPATATDAEQGCESHKDYGVGWNCDITETKNYFEEVFRKSEQKRAEHFESLGGLKKHFYVEHVDVTNMSENEAQEFRKNNMDITVENMKPGETAVPKPCIKFEHAFHNFPDILSEIQRNGFTKPSPIQSQSWPILLQGIDMIGVAQTGTGKTLAFLLPALIHIAGQDPSMQKKKGPSCLILAPTRELAQQIERECQKYSYHGIKSVCVYGGGSKAVQVRAIHSGAQIIIATPGRLNDLLQDSVIDLATFSYVVLDEADRMLDMGFEPQIRHIIHEIRPDRQTVMTSATWPRAVQKLATKYMTNPIKVNIGSLDLNAAASVTQNIMFVDEGRKLEKLYEVLRTLKKEDKIIIFCSKIKTVEFVASRLSEKVRVQKIHGGREQSYREIALRELRNGTVHFLVATDVASRGLDVPDITQVINYDFPTNIEEYVHRIGRTGRAGRKGVSTTFFTRSDKQFAKGLISILEKSGQEVPQELQSIAKMHNESSGYSYQHSYGYRR